MQNYNLPERTATLYSFKVLYRTDFSNIMELCPQTDLKIFRFTYVLWSMSCLSWIKNYIYDSHFPGIVKSFH